MSLRDVTVTLKVKPVKNEETLQQQLIYQQHSDVWVALSMTTKPCLRDSDLRRELWTLAKLAVQLSLVSACDYSAKVMTTIFAGHFLSTDEFDAVALGNTMTNITGYSMIYAIVSPMDSLCTQANGARNWKLFSVTVHRAVICTVLFLIPTVLLWLNMDKVLVLCGQNPMISANVYQWTLVYLVMLPAYVIQTITVRFLSSQGIAKPLLYIGIVVYVIWHPSMLYLVFVVLAKRDFVWAPLCNIVTAYVQIAIMMTYIVTKKPHHSLSFQRVSWSQIFRWNTKMDRILLDGDWDSEVNLGIPAGHGAEGRSRKDSNPDVIDRGIGEYIRLVVAGICP